MEKTLQILGIISLSLAIIISADFYIERISIKFKSQQDQIQAIQALAKQQNEIINVLKQPETKGK